MTYLESKNILLNRYKHNNATYDWIMNYYHYLKDFLLALKSKKEGKQVDLDKHYTILNYFWDKFLDTEEICDLLLEDRDLIDFGDTSLYRRCEEVLEGVE